MIPEQTFSVDSSGWLAASRPTLSFVFGLEQECSCTTSPSKTHQVFVIGTNRSVSDTMLASERVLAKDWDTPQEDKAWANL
jgi:hypothetical protein